MRLQLVLVIAPVLASLVSCRGPEDGGEPQLPGPTILPGSRGAPVELERSRELDEIARLEDERSDGDGALLEFLKTHEDSGVRARAAVALGRLPYPRFGAPVTEVLAAALEDPSLEVRAAAAFALGQRADPTSAGVLLAYRNDSEPLVRARVVEAASHIDEPLVRQQLVLSLRDSDLGVRMEAAVGTARWNRESPDAAEIDRALLDALRPYHITPQETPKTAVEAELVWRLLFALGRRKAELGRGPFLEYARSEYALERIFALRGLAQLEPEGKPVATNGGKPAPPSDSVRAAIDALSGPQQAADWRAAYEATVLLGRAAHPAAIPALREASEHASPHVRSGAMDALGSFTASREDALPILQRGSLDLSAGVRAAALRARTRLLNADDALELLGRHARDDDPVVRAGVVDAAGRLTDPRATQVLQRLCRDPSLFVSTRAVEALGKHPGPETRELLHGLLAHPDNGIRLAAVLGLREMPEESDVGPLGKAFESSQGDIAAEVAFNALQNLGEIGGVRAEALVERALDDPRPWVRAVAARVLERSFGKSPEPSTAPLVAPEREVPLPGEEFPLWRFNPLVEIATSRGSMVFELFPAEAPVHVHNFLSLVESKAYDGLSFHRVVPDFVVQGGDYRGDGNGGKPWEGSSLRAEITPRKYTRGSLGMPRNEDLDSGGSQFFVTHLPTPHLDGRYTIFGELRTGGDVLDRLEVGDRILAARMVR